MFHRVDDLLDLSGPLFFKLVWRLPAYEGVMRAVVMAEYDQQSNPGAGASATSPRSPGGGEWNPGTQATLQADPALKGLFSFG